MKRESCDVFVLWTRARTKSGRWSRWYAVRASLYRDALDGRAYWSPGVQECEVVCGRVLRPQR